jgi:hypothetical protein
MSSSASLKSKPQVHPTQSQTHTLRKTTQKISALDLLQPQIQEQAATNSSPVVNALKERMAAVREKHSMMDMFSPVKSGIFRV